MLITRFFQWLGAVFHKWRAAVAGIGIALAGAHYLVPPTSQYGVILHSLEISVIGYTAITAAVFLAWKEERDRIEDVDYRPALVLTEMVQYQEYAEQACEMTFRLELLKGEIVDSEAIVYPTFGRRFNPYPKPQVISIGHLASGQPFMLKPQRMKFPSGVTTMADAAKNNFGFLCEIALRFTSTRNGKRYQSDEVLVYNTERRNFDVKREHPPRVLPTANELKRKELFSSLGSWFGSASS
jgi:hypothetical protein